MRARHSKDREQARSGVSVVRIVVLAALALVALGTGTPASARAQAAAQIQLGSQTLTLCGSAPVSYCGTLSVPLDYRARSGPQISIAYEWYPATAPLAGQTPGTVVPVEGGPGYPSIESVSFESLGANSGYSAMYGALLEHSNMLAVDNRGTGSSTPLNCPALQAFAGETGTEAFQQTAAGCAEALNHRWKYPDGSWVHASDLFTSTPAADDLAAVIKALALAKVDIYGDSYGSFFAQVFANHFPQMLRSVVLDSTYQTANLDPWYRSSIASMPAAFEAACSRAPACAQAASPSEAWARIGALAARLREAPISGRVPGPTGALEKISMDVVGLVNLVSDSAEDQHVYRDLDAAGRALLDQDNPAPLLRLYAQRLYEDESYFDLPVHEYSVELYVAVSCLDYPQLFNMSSSHLAREGELASAEAALPASTFSPFSTQEWIAQNQNTEAYTVCLGWPSPTAAEPPTTGSFPLFPASLPVLVLGGEFDTWTPPVDHPKVLAEIGGDARFIELANSTHVVGEGDTECGASLIQRFVADPGAIATLDASCAAAVSPIHTVGEYPSALGEVQPITAAPASSASPADRQLAAVAVATAGDAISRYTAIEASVDHGLYGGSVKTSHGGAMMKLKRDQLIPGVTVSGTLKLVPAPLAVDGDAVLATLTVSSHGMHAAKLTATWTTAGAGAEADVIGTVGHEALSGSIAAP
jgi:pimeloyl-ACP methyl ester carboxylesterase